MKHEARFLTKIPGRRIALLLILGLFTLSQIPSVSAQVRVSPPEDGGDSAEIPFDGETAELDIPQVGAVDENGNPIDPTCIQELAACEASQEFCPEDCLIACDENNLPMGCEGQICGAPAAGPDCIPEAEVCPEVPLGVDCEIMFDFCEEVYERCGYPEDTPNEDPNDPTDPEPEDEGATQVTPGNQLGISGSGCALATLGTTPLQAMLTLLLFFVPSLLGRYRRH